METQPWPSAEDLDGWYADMSGSPVKDEIQRPHLGLPPHLLSTSLLGWAAIAEVAETLRLSPGDALLDEAASAGGPAGGPCGERPQRSTLCCSHSTTKRHAIHRNPRPDMPGHCHRRRAVDAHSMR
jgi:hypothetical protein